jgi:hypothetical protein
VRKEFDIAEGRRKKEEGRRKREEGRGKKEEGRGKREDTIKLIEWFILLNSYLN